MARKRFFVWYDGKYIADYYYLRPALDYIRRNCLRSDDNHSLSLVDLEGTHYNPHNGSIII